MEPDLTNLIVERYQRSHQLLIQVSQRIRADDFSRPIGSVASLRADWQVWHVARWSDSFTVGLVSDMPAHVSHVVPQQVWHEQKLEAAWGLSSIALGEEDAGTGLDDDATATLSLPRKAKVLAYARRVFEREHAAIASVIDALQGTRVFGDVVEALLSNLDHDNRHLGMLEAVVGTLQAHGSADD